MVAVGIPRRLRQEDHLKFEAILSYVTSLGSAWTDPEKKKNPQKTKKQKPESGAEKWS